jgi:DNA invertase Pin-like site-specific DNA recombinase
MTTLAYKLAYSYIRFSSADQIKGASLSRQDENAQRWIDQHPEHGPLRLDTTLNMRDLGVSAFRGMHATKGKLGAFIRAIDTGRVQRGSYLLVENFDRMDRRRTLEALSLLISILEKGIVVVIISANKVFTHETVDDFDLMYAMFEMSRSHQESVRKREFSSKNWARKRKRAATEGHKITHKCPAWLGLEDGRFVVLEDRVRLIERIYSMCLDGYGAIAITKTLNEERIPTWNKSDGWNISYIQTILHTPAVYGVFTPGLIDNTKLEPIPDYFPVIIPKDTFLRAQHAMAARTGKGGKPGGRINIFAALLRCGCGGSIVRLNKGRRSLPIFTCDRGRRGMSSCGYAPWPVEEVERIILTHLTGLDVRSLFTAQESTLATIRASRAAIEVGIARTQDQLNRLADAVAQGGELPTLIARIQSLEVEIVGSRAQLSELVALERSEMMKRSNATVASEQIQALVASDDESMRVRLRGHIRDLIQVIIIDLKTREISLLYNIKADSERKFIGIFKDGNRAIDPFPGIRYIVKVTK